MSKLDLAAAVAHLRRADPGLAEWIDRVGPPRLRRHRSAFDALVRAIVFQQLHGRAAATIHGRFLALLPPGAAVQPSAVAALPVEAMRRVGLSGQKAAYLKDLAQKFLDGTVRPRSFPRLSDEEVSKHLTQVKGIGQWTVDMFLILNLRRPDVLPLGDLGVRKAIKLLFDLEKLPDAPTMLELAERWRPYRSVATWYLWRGADTLPPD